MPTSNRCPTCQVELPADAPAGLCPACLLKAGMTSDHIEAGTRTATQSFTPPTPAELAPHFPQLEILELIGQGGMGAVYKAKQVRLDRIVALKVLPKDADKGQEFADRFTREAKAMARLGHPNIITIHDYGEAGGWFYFVMEYVDGVNMRQAMKAEPIQPKDALAIVMQICDALQYAHEENVVHRDIKPENILLNRKGKVKIADFGLAKLLGLSAMDRHLTGTQQVMGTIGYMAPEQMEGSKAIDHRADIYALGVVFYELLTGELPMGRFEPPSHKVQIDVRIDEVVLKSLEKEPSRRYQSASQIKHEVERISGGNTADPTFARVAVQEMGSQRKRLLILGATMVALGIIELAIGIAAIFSHRHFRMRLDFIRDASSPMVQFGFVLTMLDFLGLSWLVLAGGLMIIGRAAYGIAFVGAFAAIVPLAAIGVMITPNREEIVSNQWVILFFGWLGVPLGLWSLLELSHHESAATFGKLTWPRTKEGWRFLYPRILNSTLLTTLIGVCLLCFMLFARWVEYPFQFPEQRGRIDFFWDSRHGLAIVFISSGLLLMLIVTWQAGLQPVLWRLLFTLFGAIGIMLIAWDFQRHLPFDAMQKNNPWTTLGYFAAWAASGVFFLNGLWRLLHWWSQGRPISETPKEYESIDPQNLEPAATTSFGITDEKPKSGFKSFMSWLATVGSLAVLGGLGYNFAEKRGWIESELYQNGEVQIAAGAQGQVFFPEPFKYSPNVSLPYLPKTNRTVVTHVTPYGFHWKNYSKETEAHNFNTMWTARGRRGIPQYGPIGVHIDNAGPKGQFERIFGTWSWIDGDWVLKFHPDKKFDESLPDGQNTGEYEMRDGASLVLISTGTLERITRQYTITSLNDIDLIIKDTNGPNNQSFRFRRISGGSSDKLKP